MKKYFQKGKLSCMSEMNKKRSKFILIQQDRLHFEAILVKNSLSLLWCELMCQTETRRFNFQVYFQKRFRKK